MPTPRAPFNVENPVWKTAKMVTNYHSTALCLSLSVQLYAEGTPPALVACKDIPIDTLPFNCEGHCPGVWVNLEDCQSPPAAGGGGGGGRKGSGRGIMKWFLPKGRRGSDGVPDNDEDDAGAPALHLQVFFSSPSTSRFSLSVCLSVCLSHSLTLSLTHTHKQTRTLPLHASPTGTPSSCAAPDLDWLRSYAIYCAGDQAPQEGGGRAFENMSDEELLVWLTEIFVAADSDNNGE